MKKKLKSIKQHEKDFWKNYKEPIVPKEESLSGFECPECGAEMLINNMIILTSNPPQSRLRCPKCGKISSIH